jgi:DNA invertase Pin-like site-specific DNA recombinase
MFAMLSVFAQFERTPDKKKSEGIALAKASRTIYKGRKPWLNAEKIVQLGDQVAMRTVVVQFARTP